MIECASPEASSQVTKASLRARMRQWRRTLSAAAAGDAGRALVPRLASVCASRSARRICAYCSTAGEVATGPILEWCHATGRAICVPAWQPGPRRYGLAWFRPGMLLRPGPLGIPEPADPEWVAPTVPIDIALVPGLAFDLRGGRLGHGGGHFDRLLAGLPGPCFRIGLAFDAQIVDAVPMNALDVHMHMTITQTHAWVCHPALPDGSAEVDRR